MDIYGQLKSSVKGQISSKKSQTSGKSCKEKLEGLFSKVLPATQLSEANVDELKHKIHVLDDARKKWKPATRSRSRNILSAQDIRKHKIFDIKPEGCRFEDFLPLHRLWEEYMQDILDRNRFSSKDSGQRRENNERLLKADYHGCYIVVRRSKCASLLGQAGIVLMETKNMFKVIAKDNKIKCFPKAHSVFAFQLDSYLFTIHGNNFCISPSQRSRRKFKPKASVDL